MTFFRKCNSKCRMSKASALSFTLATFDGHFPNSRKVLVYPGFYLDLSIKASGDSHWEWYSTHHVSQARSQEFLRGGAIWEIFLKKISEKFSENSFSFLKKKRHQFLNVIKKVDNVFFRKEKFFSRGAWKSGPQLSVGGAIAPLAPPLATGLFLAMLKTFTNDNLKGACFLD